MTNLNIEKLKSNIIEQVIEAQIKLGYAKETVRLYYQIESLKIILGYKKSDEELLDELKEQYADDKVKVVFGRHKDRVEVSVMPESVEYIYRNVERPEFLEAMINLFSNNHHLELQDIEELFSRFDSSYACEKMSEGSDFDYVFYFNNKTIDEYYYCVKMEMGHTIYHRFIKEDYEALLG